MITFKELDDLTGPGLKMVDEDTFYKTYLRLRVDPIKQTGRVTAGDKSTGPLGSSVELLPADLRRMADWLEGQLANLKTADPSQ